jgi:hypothetical protein
MELSHTTDFCVAVRAYINTVIKSDPIAFSQLQEFLDQRRDRHAAMRNDRGMSENEEFKFTISMPELLGALVFKQFPEILDNKKNMYKFMRAFPEFCASSAPFKTKYDAR